MKRTAAMALRALMIVMAVIVGTSFCHADETEITEEFANEGIEKAEAAMMNIVNNINEINTMEELAGLQKVINSMEFRNVRKKYGKIKLTDDYRARLLVVNKAMLQAMMNMLDRVAAPFEIREALKQEMTEEKLEKELKKAKTLREAMS
ncbi:MAG: hypothetical protein HDS68_03030 [Bacteroidales bacterium]|nr:hypothetical protein [Bacteroidales bacterium]